jgi:hypothetical protein
MHDFKSANLQTGVTNFERPDATVLQNFHFQLHKLTTSNQIQFAAGNPCPDTYSFT